MRAHASMRGLMVKAADVERALTVPSCLCGRNRSVAKPCVAHVERFANCRSPPPFMACGQALLQVADVHDMF